MHAFTLIETLITLSLVAVLASLALSMSMSAYRGNSVDTEREILMALLVRARTESLETTDDTSHGVCYAGPESSYEIFSVQDATISSEIMLPISTSEVVLGLPDCTQSGIIFSKYAGTTTAAYISLTSGVETIGIRIDDTGRVERS